MNSSDYSIFEQYPTRTSSLWNQGQPTYLEIDHELRQSPNDSPIYIKDQCDQFIARPQYQLVNQYLVSTNCFVNLSNLYLKSVTHNEVQGLYRGLLVINHNCQEKMNFFIIWRRTCNLEMEILHRQIYNPKEFFEALQDTADLIIQKDLYKLSILKLIGQGSHAKVYKIQRKQDSSIFAVKIFKKMKVLQKEKGVASLVLEIDVMRKLDHENVIQLYEVFEDSEKVYLIIDHLRGGDLFQKVQNSLEDYSEHVVQNLMNNILNSLKYLHAKNIIHRDIKPENMIFRSKSNMIDIVIADFGLSDIYNNLQLLKLYNENDIYLFQKCGTVGYVAPEVLKDQAYNHKVDIFSVGVILFILLTGQMPFANYENSEELVKSNYFCQIDYDKFNNKNISEQAQSLVKLLLEENVSKRPTAEEALLHEWFTNPKTETFCNLPVNLVPSMCIRKNQDNVIKSSTPLWGQNGSFCDSPLLQKQNQYEENQFESKYYQFKQVNFLTKTLYIILNFNLNLIIIQIQIVIYLIIMTFNLIILQKFNLILK